MNEFFLYSYVIASGIALSLILVYLPRIIAWFGAFLPYEKLHNETKNSIAVLIPARNESAVIGSLLSSLQHQTYSNFEVFVIVKDPADPTLQLVKNASFHENHHRFCRFPAFQSSDLRRCHSPDVDHQHS